jgi:hypothetical protein
MRFNAAADLIPTCLVNRAAVRAENTALVIERQPLLLGVKRLDFQNENAIGFVFRGLKFI